MIITTDSRFDEICSEFEQLDQDTETKENAAEMTFEEFMDYENRFQFEQDFLVADLIISGQL